MGGFPAQNRVKWGGAENESGVSFSQEAEITLWYRSGKSLEEESQQDETEKIARNETF